MAVAFDLDRLEIGGRPFPVLANVMQALNFTDTGINTGAGQYSISDSGALAYVPGGIEADTEDSLVHVDLKGNIQPVVDFKAPFFAPRFSPDGKQIAYHTIGKQYQLWIYDRASGSASRLISDGITVCSEWTRDGKHLVFNWSKIIGFKLYWQPTDRSSPMERLVADESLQYPGSFSRDGAILAFIDALSVSNTDIHLLDMKSRRVTPFINSQAWEAFPAISPDGRWMAYSSNESERAEVWIRPFPGQGGKWKISSERGTEPIWSKDGKQLYYREANRVWAADIRTGESLSHGKPRLLFEKQGLVWGSPARNWDLWPDGQGFIMVKEEEIKPQPVTEMILIQNWFEELKRLVPAK
jgi:serine/threonine-protein kinase